MGLFTQNQRQSMPGETALRVISAGFLVLQFPWLPRELWKDWGKGFRP